LLRSQRSAVDRIMAEAGFYAPRLAATALVQAEGDAIEASFILRSLRASLPRIEPALPVEVQRRCKGSRVRQGSPWVPSSCVITMRILTPCRIARCRIAAPR